MTDEFEDREQGLGELPDFEGYSNIIPDNIPSRIAPADIVKQAESYNDGKGKIGSPVIPASVTTVYDARPVNARDFVFSNVDNVAKEVLPNGGPGSPEKSTPQAAYIVPAGFTGVLRGFAFEPAVFAGFTSAEKCAGDEINSVKASLFINNIVVPDFQNIPCGQSINRLFPTFVVAGEGQTFKLILSVSTTLINRIAVGNGAGNPCFYKITLYGNNLLTRGMPTPFEIASQNMSGSNK